MLSYIYFHCNNGNEDRLEKNPFVNTINISISNEVNVLQCCILGAFLSS
mgnify:CR=1